MAGRQEGRLPDLWPKQGDQGNGDEVGVHHDELVLRQGRGQEGQDLVVAAQRHVRRGQVLQKQRGGARTK